LVDIPVATILNLVTHQEACTVEIAFSCHQGIPLAAFQFQVTGRQQSGGL
jgi:hypothetical protein